jgi:putative ATP-binding cassette transporter
MNPSSLFAKFSAFRHFAGRIAALAAPYFRSEEKWKARGLLLAIVLLNLGTVYMAVQFNDWYRVFYDALEKRDQAVFWQQMGRFSYLAFGAIIIAVYKFYLTQLLQMRWRAWMTRDYLRRWLSHHAFYKMELARYSAATDINASPDNPDQRIQEDVQSFTTSTIYADDGRAQCGRDAGQFCRHPLDPVGSASASPWAAAATPSRATWSGPRWPIAWSAACWPTTSAGR